MNIDQLLASVQSTPIYSPHSVHSRAADLAEGRPGLVNVDQLLASDEQFLLAESQAMQAACEAAFQGLEASACLACLLLCCRLHEGAMLAACAAARFEAPPPHTTRCVQRLMSHVVEILREDLLDCSEALFTTPTTTLTTLCDHPLVAGVACGGNPEGGPPGQRRQGAHR